VDASEYSFAYVVRWAESREVVRVALANIRKTVPTPSRMVLVACETLQTLQTRILLALFSF
jgi:hypothetical protein